MRSEQTNPFERRQQTIAKLTNFEAKEEKKIRSFIANIFVYFSNKKFRCVLECAHFRMKSKLYNYKNEKEVSRKSN